MKPIRSRGATKDLLKALERVAKNDPNEYMVDDLGRAVVNMLPAAEVETQGYEPRDLSLDVLKAMGVVAREGLGMVPVVGELLDAAEIDNARRYGTDFYGEEISPQLLGALTAAGYLLPNIVERPLKAIAKPIRRMLGNSDFVSEIDWSKWNPDTPNHPELMNEYLDIEKRTKEDGTWMKNADGTDFQGSPEQFVQQQSSHYKAAYPTGAQKAYRGVHTRDPISSKIDYSSDYLTPNVFASLDKDQARMYSGMSRSTFTPLNMPRTEMFDEQGRSKLSHGIFELLYPNQSSLHPRIEIDATGSHYSDIKPSQSLEESLNSIKTDGRVAFIPNGRGMNKSFSLDKAESIVDDLIKTWENYDPSAVQTFMDEAINKLENKGRIFTPGNPRIETDDLSLILGDMDVNSILLKNLDDEGVGDVIINKNQPGSYLKSAVGNVGFFDLNDPDVFKSVVPLLGLSTAIALRERQRGS